MEEGVTTRAPHGGRESRIVCHCLLNFLVRNRRMWKLETQKKGGQEFRKSILVDFTTFHPSAMGVQRSEKAPL